MKTIEETISCRCQFSKNYVDIEISNEAIDCFKAGVEFAQEWITIERDSDGFCTDKSFIEITSNLPVIVKDIDGFYDVWNEIDGDLEKNEYTHWRPIERK